MNKKEVKYIPYDPLFDSYLITLMCKVCKREYVEHFQRQCFAYNMILETIEDVCIGCRMYKAAKLESAIEDMLADLSLVVRHPREACATLLEKCLFRAEELPANIQKKLDKIPLTYPRNLKDKLCPIPCDICDEYRRETVESEFEVVNEGELHEFDAEKAHEVIKLKLQGFRRCMEGNGSTEG